MSWRIQVSNSNSQSQRFSYVSPLHPRTSKTVNTAPNKYSLMRYLLGVIYEEDKLSKVDLIELLTMVLEASTIMPFRWFSNRFMCFYCCCPFMDSTKLKQHTKEEHHEVKFYNAVRLAIGSSRIKLDISDISCKKCSKPVSNLDEFITHLEEAHKMKVDTKLLDYVLSFKLSDETMFCIDCGEKFRFFGTLLAHVHKSHNRTRSFLCDMCGRGFVTKLNLDSHMRSHLNLQHHCKLCDKSFKSEYFYRNHCVEEHQVDKWKCPKCSEVLATKYLRKRHMVMVHDTKSQFPCDVCSKTFMFKSKLLQHKSRVHLKERFFACEICGFKVFSRDLLKRHMVKHDDSRPFECDFCKKSFQRKKTLEFHRRIHTNDRRYVCNECGKSFVQVTSLKLHLRVHHGGS